MQVKVIPNAAKSAVIGWQGDVLKVRLHAPPEKGQANEELIACLADHLQIPKSSIQIVSGLTSRLKRVRIRPLA
ncbi:MAG: DUF167 domain-containing protein [Chlamydiia bacterium]|nr:DUF167 domain-containing protein [Chlamydiia bacterium]